MASVNPLNQPKCRPDELRSILARILGTTTSSISVTTTDQFKSDLKLAGFPAPGWIENTQAFYEPSSERIVLFADRIPKASAAAVLAHELVHKNGRQLLKGSQWDAVITALKSWSSADQKSTEWSLYAKAHAKAKYGTQRRPEFYEEELFAYAVEEAFKLGLAPDADLSIETAEGWLARAQGVLERLARTEVTGEQPVLEAQDVIALAYALAQIERTFDRGELVFSRSAYEAGRQAVTPKELKLFDAATAMASRGPLPNSPEFKAWFSDSAVVTDKGAPLVVYHGTNKAFDAFSRETAGTATGDPNAVLGFFFTTSASEAALYAHGEGANVVPVHLRIQKPYEATMDELASLEAEDYEAMLEDLVAQGHDGIVAETDDGSHRWFVAFEPNQIVSMFDRNYPVDPLREQARQFEENSSNIYSADDFNWTERTLSRAEFLPLIGGEEGLSSDSSIDTSLSDFSRPVIVAEEPDGTHLWDGVHRAVSAGKLGLNEIRALVGTYKWGNDLTPVRWRTPDAGNSGQFNPLDPDIRRSQPGKSTVLEDFKAWFGQSKVVDSVGAPLKMFHGTNKTFSSFDPRHLGSFFSSSQQVASDYGNNVLSVYVSLQNPLAVDAKGREWSDIPFSRKLKKLAVDIGFPFKGYENGKTIDTDTLSHLAKLVGYDGLLVTNVDDAKSYSELSTLAVAFRSEQIRGAEIVDRELNLLKAGAQQVASKRDDSDDAFKAWFENSKVVDGQGKPLVVHHGTNAKFSVFGAGRGAIYFTDDHEVAEVYAQHAIDDGFDDEEVGEPEPVVMSVYLSMKNPLVLDEAWAKANLDGDGERDWMILDNVIFEAEAAGYDGVILRDVVDFAGMDGDRRLTKPYTQFIVFSPQQIKSATENVGAFDPKSTDIRFSQSVLRTDGFNRWFDGSQVVDAVGEPLVLYHGTFADFSAFDPEESFDGGFHFGTSEAANARNEYWFDAATDSAKPNIMPVYLAIKNPKRLDFDPYSEEEWREQIELARAEGFDGIAYPNKVEGGESWVTFKPEQIKSAIGNNGDFNALNPDIRFSQIDSETEDKRDAPSSIPAGLRSIGYKLLPRGDARRFKQFGTWEKDGVRIALSGDLLAFERGAVIKYVSDGDAMTLEALITDPAVRNQGRARQALRDVIGFADQLGLTLYIEPVPLESDAGISKDQLSRFYAEFGFVKDDPSGKVLRREASAPKPEQTDGLEWFGKSKIVDKDGHPLVVYHGTNADFDQFDPNLVGTNFEVSTGGFFFSSSKTAAKDYADDTARERGGTPSVIEVNLGIDNPLVINATGNPDRYFDKARFVILSEATDGDHDGIVVNGFDADGEPQSLYLVFEPDQIRRINESEEAESTKAFKQWFGGSQVVDKAGEPLVMYHGTDAAFTVFDKTAGKHGRNTFSFHADPKLARQYGASLMPVYLRVENPFDYENPKHQKELQRLLRSDKEFETWWIKEAKIGDWEMLERPVVQAYLKANGFDGFYVNDRPGKAMQVFEPEQIKSANGNSGEFNPLNPDIRFSLAASSGNAMGTSEKNLSKLLAQQQEYLANPVAYYEQRLKAIADELKSRFDIWATQSGNGDEAKFSTEDSDFENPEDLPETARALAREFLRLDEEWSLGETGHPPPFMEAFYEAQQEEEDNPEPLTDRQKVTNLLMDGLHGRLPGKEEQPKRSRTTDQARTEPFKRWFGDSKVTDADGNPLVVYHGSGSPNIKKFKPGVDGAGWFAISPSLANAFASAGGGGYGDTVYPAYLSLQNPLDTRTEAGRAVMREANEKNPAGTTADQLAPLGYDGVISDEWGGKQGDIGTTYLAFHPEQIKSAIGNNGDFNPLNPDIRFSQTGHEAFEPIAATHARIQFLLASTSPAQLPDLQPAVAGKTEKPGGTDPTRHLSPTGVYRLGRVPLEIFVGNEEGDRYDGTVQAARMLDYVGRNGASAPPVIAAVPRRDPSGKLRILDGGHRISAARHRGDSHINAIVDTRNLGVHLQKIASDALPEDILDTLQSLYGEVGRDVPPTVSARLIPLSAFPETPLGGLGDPRGEAHARAMIGKAMPPVIVHELDWLDGRHRVWAARQEGREHLLAIDVGFDLPKSVVQAIAPIGRLGLPNAGPSMPVWFNTVLSDGELGEPLMLFHGTRSAGGLDRFIPGGPVGAAQRGDAYGVGAYLTTSQSEASVYAGAEGAVLPVYVSGRVLDVDAPLSAELQAQMTGLARQLLLPSDKARFGMGRKQQTFDSKADAQAFFDAQRLNWEAFGDRMERCRPEVVSNKDGQLVIEYADYDAPLQIQTPQDLWTLLKAVGFEVVRDYGYDGIMMTRGEDDARHRWVVMYNALGTIKSAIGNNGDFNPYDPRICHSLADTSAETPAVDDEDDSETERMRA